MTHEDIVNLNAARSAARMAGMFVVEKAGKFLLYRLCRPRNVLVGSRQKADDLRRLVTRAATTTRKEPS
jgi:hypothetical protein